MKVLIIGADGFLGRKAFEIMSKTHDVVGTALIAKQGLLELDITNKSKVVEVITENNPELIFNCAGLVDVNGAEKNKTLALEINLFGTVYLAEICAKKNIKLVVISSDYVFSGDNSPYVESSKPHPKSFYGLTKSLMEELVLKINSGSIIIRPSILYGLSNPREIDRLVIPILESLRKGEPIVINDFRPKYPVLLEDFINNLLLLIQKNEKGIFHFASSKTDRYEMAKIVAREFELDEKLIKKAEPVRDFGIKPFDVNLLNTRATYLKFNSFEEGVKTIKEQLSKE
jgi:dTDP-4-dehydrorhamnose reductase